MYPSYGDRVKEKVNNTDELLEHRAYLQRSASQPLGSQHPGVSCHLLLRLSADGGVDLIPPGPTDEARFCSTYLERRVGSGC